jgi:hypothetical protein
MYSTRSEVDEERLPDSAKAASDAVKEVSGIRTRHGLWRCIWCSDFTYV